VIRGRRGSQEFHDLVEDPSTSGARQSSYADLLGVVEALRAQPAPEPDPAFVLALRERLLEEAETVLVAAAAERADTDERLRLRPSAPRTRRRNRRLAAGISGVILVGASGTMAVAAQTALPGDRLYPLKRGLESAHAQLTFDRAARGRVLLDNASTRLDEVAELSRTGGSSDDVSRTLDAFTQESIDGSDLLIADYQATGDQSSVTSVRTFTAASMAQLRMLQHAVPTDSVDELLQAAQSLDQVQQVATRACPTCAGPSVTQVPTVLTRSAEAAADSWLVALPSASGTHDHSGPGPGGVKLPQVGGDLPPASVTDPTQTAPDLALPTAHQVQHTLQHLTDGLTHNQQSDLGSTVTDTATNLLDAVGDVGNTLADTLDGTLDDLGSALPSALPTLP
jgi:Domain of unknown function (DUF5667)